MNIDFKLIVLLAIVFFIAKEDKPKPKIRQTQQKPHMMANPPPPPQMGSPPRVPDRVGEPFVQNNMAYMNQGSDTAMFESLNPAPRRIGSAFLYSSPESF